MPNIYETLEKNYLMYGKSQIHVIIDDDDKVWFNIKDSLLALGYKDYSGAIKKHVDKRYVKKRKHINTSQLFMGQSSSLYITESGLYRMISRSRLQSAIEFTDWIFDDVIPKLRKFGKYQVKKSLENERNQLFDRINFLEKQNEQFQYDLKKEKFPNGAVFYVIDHSTGDENVYRIGISDSMKFRKWCHDSHCRHKHRVVFITELKLPIQLEACVRSLLYEYRVKNRKDFYNCSLYRIKKTISMCLQGIKKNRKKIIKQKGGSKRNSKLNYVHTVYHSNVIQNLINEIKNDINVLDNQIYNLNEEFLEK